MKFKNKSPIVSARADSNTLDLNQELPAGVHDDGAVIYRRLGDGWYLMFVYSDGAWHLGRQVL
jgi:hypothetical protein